MSRFAVTISQYGGINSPETMQQGSLRGIFPSICPGGDTSSETIQTPCRLYLPQSEDTLFYPGQITGLSHTTHPVTYLDNRGTCTRCLQVRQFGSDPSILDFKNPPRLYRWCCCNRSVRGHISASQRRINHASIYISIWLRGIDCRLWLRGTLWPQGAAPVVTSLNGQWAARYETLNHLITT